MSKQDFKIKKGLNVNEGIFVANEDGVTVNGADVIDAVEMDAAILVETNARVVADGTLQTNIDDEGVARDAAIAVEAGLRGDADVVLQGNIDTVASGFDNGVGTLTTAEVTQLGNIGENTISTSQWSWIGVFNQPLSTSNDVTFNSISGDGSGLTSLPNIFDQSLNVADSVSFADMTTSTVNAVGGSDFVIFANGRDALKINDSTGQFVGRSDQYQLASVSGTTSINIAPSTGNISASSGSIDLTFSSTGGDVKVSTSNDFYANTIRSSTSNNINLIPATSQVVNITGNVVASGSLTLGATDCVLDPTVVATTTAYTFDTANTITSGKVASFSNNTTEVLAVASAGVNVTGTYSVNGNVGVSGTGTTITAITVENGIITAITVT